MIRNVGGHNNTAYLNDVKKNDVQDANNVEKQTLAKQSRVDDLKKQIQSGAYQIDLKATATKMAQELKPDL
ncbi:flagellar biosynthesis anti-sigma factor FlgM [Hydrogenimonas sp. SS33]|uniref:flagellar biosynthesis anti-sigma factor FlgM n=1 Tax=Hydrogenimonas leucolamina TaxID=2954236 RepID=UPI00336BD40B